MDEQKPGPVEWSVGSALGVAAVLTAALTRKWWISLILLGLLLLVVGGYIAWRLWKRRRNEQKFSGDMEQQSGNANVRKAEQKAQLDQLRRAFQQGILVYKQRKKDIYSVPWYLMIGTPGSGKTEAIRHSEIGFPPGLTDPMTGVGGTINMNWWFTNYGVILDTAGKMVFPEAGGGGQSNEWDEFLRLLRKHRPACPINGLFLALDVDKMIKDTGEAISKKASQVAQQLDRVQRALDVRFPVYVLVTKSDFLTGFKEYFDGIDDPQLQNQILGWSNQAPLDGPVDTDAIEGYLRELVEIIKRRRLAVIRAPINLDLRENRRLDCTDAMFAFPESLERLIPRLKRYLQIIFSSGEFSAKPVFLRGIYFTSSMQQNGDLDEALAEFMGIKVTELPPANVQEKEKSYFLRDMFIDKAFQERLVTSASNTRRMRRNRLLILSGLTVLILGSLVTFSLLGHGALDRSVGKDKVIWEEATNQWVLPPWASGSSFWHPVVDLSNGNDWRYTGGEPLSSKLTNSLVDFLGMLKDRVSRPSSNIPLIFRPLRGLRGDLKFPEGQRVLVERSVVLPLLEGARYKMSRLEVSAPQDTEGVIRLRKALECLVQTQADIDAGLGSLSNAVVQEKLASFVTPLLQFVVNTNLPINSSLLEACAWTYSSSGAGAKAWPPKALSGGTNLASDLAINTGLDCLIAQVRKNQQQVEGHAQLLAAVCASLSALAQAEDTLNADAVNDCALTREHFEAWQAAVKDLRSAQKEAAQQRVLDISASAGLLRAAANKIELENSAASGEAFKEIRRGADAGAKRDKRPLFGEITNKCQVAVGGMQSKVESTLAKYMGSLSNWDNDFLATGSSAVKPCFEQRDDLYQNAFVLRNPTAAVPVGSLQKTLVNWRQGRDSISAQIESYKGPLKPQLQRVCQCAIDESDKRGLDGLLSNYCATAEAKLSDYFNASTVSFDRITEAHAFFTNLDSDLGLQSFRELPPRWQDKLQKLHNDDADATKKSVSKAYTNWLADQLSARGGGPDSNNPLQPYLDFRKRWDSVTNQLNSDAVKYFSKELGEQFPQWAAKEARNRLDEGVKFCNDWLNQNPGFPVLLGTAAPRTPEQVALLKRQLDLRANEFKQVQDGDQTLAFKSFTNRVSVLSQVVAVLVPDPGRPAKHTVDIHPVTGDAANQCPYLYLTTAGGKAQRLTLGRKRDPSVALSDLTGALEIKVTSGPDPDTPGAGVFYINEWKSWGALNLINLANVRFEGGKWIVPIPVKNSDGSDIGAVHVELEFNPPLPSPEQWQRLNPPPP